MYESMSLSPLSSVLFQSPFSSSVCELHLLLATPHSGKGVSSRIFSLSSCATLPDGCSSLGHSVCSNPDAWSQVTFKPCFIKVGSVSLQLFIIRHPSFQVIPQDSDKVQWDEGNSCTLLHEMPDCCILLLFFHQAKSLHFPPQTLGEMCNSSWNTSFHWPWFCQILTTCQLRPVKAFFDLISTSLDILGLDVLTIRLDILGTSCVYISHLFIQLCSAFTYSLSSYPGCQHPGYKAACFLLTSILPYTMHLCVSCIKDHSCHVRSCIYFVHVCMQRRIQQQTCRGDPCSLVPTWDPVQLFVAWGNKDAIFP